MPHEWCAECNILSSGLTSGCDLAGDAGLHRQRVDRAVVEALLDRGLDQAVLVDPREALELGSADRRPQVVAGAGFVDHLDRGARQGGLDHPLQLGEVGGHCLAGEALAEGLEHLLDPDELDPGPAVRLAAAHLGRVDRLPVPEADVAGAALAQQVLDGDGVGILGADQRPGLDIGEQVLDGLQRVFLVGPDHAGGAALDPAGGVVADLVPGVVRVEDAAAFVEDQAAPLVEGHPLDGDAGVADRAQDQAALELFALAGVLGAQGAAFLDQLVATDDDRFDLAVALDLDRGGEEAEDDPLFLALRLAPRELPQRLDVDLGRLVGLIGFEESLAGRVELDLGGVDDDVGVLHLPELLDLRVGEGGLNRTAAAEDDDLADLLRVEGLDRVVGGVGLAQLVVGESQHPGDVHRHVAVADHHGALAGEVELVVGVVGVGVVPADEGGGGMAARQVLAGDAELAVGLAADREDDRVVEAFQLLHLDVVADLDVAEEAEALAGGGFFVDPDYRLDLRVVRRDAAAHQPERGGEAVEEVNLGMQVAVLEDVLGGVEAAGAGADDGDAQGGLFGSDLAHASAKE